jgi:hypothetical protein
MGNMHIDRRPISSSLDVVSSSYTYPQNQPQAKIAISFSFRSGMMSINGHIFSFSSRVDIMRMVHNVLRLIVGWPFFMSCRQFVFTSLCDH